MPSTIHYNISRRLLIVFNFFLILGISMTYYSASAQSNKSIALPTKKSASIKSSLPSSTSSKQSSVSSNPSKLQCQNKAKEASKIVFDDCMISVKELEADNIRKEYKVKLVKLKAQYEQKLKKVLVQLKKQSKNGVVPATNEATTTNPNSETTLPPKPQNDIPVSEDSNNASFAAPTPINTQDSLATDESSSSMATTQNNTMTTKKATSPEFVDEPSVQLKQIPQSTDAPALEPEPSTNDYPSSSSYLPSDKLEGEPDSAI